MFEGFCGGKGHGKSYGLTCLLWDELLMTERTIFTNAAMFHRPEYLARLQKVADERIEHKVVNVAARVVEITATQACRYWLAHRKGWIANTQSIPVAGGLLQAPDFSERFTTALM